MRFSIYRMFSLGVLLASVGASAQEKPPAPPPLPSSCSSEVKNFCSDKSSPRDIVKCLMGHFSELAPQCKQEIERYIRVLSEAEERGGGALASFGGPNAMGPPLPLLSYDGRFMPGDDSASLSENKFGFSMPFYKGDEYTLGASLAVSQLRFGETLTLDNGKKISKDFHRYELGTQYFSQLSEKRTFSVRASAGYAGDEPSEASKDLSYSLHISYGKPGSGNGYWVYMLMMTNNSPFINFLPIPGVMYIYKTPTFTGMFGFPVVTMQWTPVMPWSYSLSIFATNIQAEVAYGQRNRGQGFISYGMNQQTYMPHEREKDRERLTIQDQKISAGFRMPIMKLMQMELQAGRSFDRSVYVGEGLMNKDGGSTSLEADWFGSLGIRMGF